MKQRKYLKNTVPGSRKGSKWPEQVKTAALADLLIGNNICAVARRHGVPESTLRTWETAARRKGPNEEKTIFEAARENALQAISRTAAAGAMASAEYIRRRLEQNEKNTKLYEEALEQLDEIDAGRLMVPEETRAGIENTAIRRRPMSDAAAATYLRTLTGVTERAGAMLGADREETAFVFRVEGEAESYAR